MPAESYTLGWGRIIASAIFLFFFVIGGVVLLTNDDRNTQLAGAAIITLGAVAIIGNGGFRYVLVAQPAYSQWMQIRAVSF